MTTVTKTPKKSIREIMPERSLVVDKEKYRQKRVAAYCRVSTDNEEQLTSYNNQMRVYTEMINSDKKCEFAGIYADEGISGTTAEKRPQFQKMIDDCLKGKIDYIITKSVSRFARNTVDCLEYIRMLKSKNIGIYFEEQNLDTLTYNSELYLVIYAGFAQAESESISKNVTWAVRKNFENGKPMFVYSKLLGYRKGEDGEPEIIPEEAEIVKRVFEMYLSGKTILDISNILKGENLEFKNKKFSFSKGMITSLLKNEKYCGDCILQKTVTLNPITKTRKTNEGEAPMYMVQNSHPAIISREIFNKTQEELSRRNTISPQLKGKAKTSTGKYSKYALTEVLKCGECGSRYKRVHWNIRGKKKIVWRCINRLENGTKYCHDSLTVEETDLQEAIVRGINKFCATDESTYLMIMRSTIADAIGLNGGSDEISLLERRIDMLNNQMMEMVNENVKNGTDIEGQEDEFKEISDQIDQLGKRITAIQENINGNEKLKSRLEEIQNTIDNRRKNCDKYDDSIVRQMIECIKVFHDGRLLIIFGGGYEIEEQIKV